MRRFNPEKELYKIQHGKRNKIIIFVFLLLIVGVMGYSFALYQVRYSKRIIYTKVAPFSDHDIELAVYVGGKKENEFPAEDRNYLFTDIDCENNDPKYTNATWDNDNRALSIWTKGPNKCNVNFDTKDFTYSDENQYYEYTIEQTGDYKIELWGAGGGPSVAGFSGLNGLGGYTSGIISLTEGTKLYIYLGEKGKKGINGFGNSSGTSFNGGGSGVGATDGDDGGGGGGGATDVRLIKGDNWDDFDSLKSRIMVAGGGAGAATLITATRAPSGGGLTGVGNSWYWQSNRSNTSFNATQTTGNAFGIGGNGHANGTGGSGGGGGYYGGKEDNVNSCYGTGGGGSSFISGHPGCDAISDSSNDFENIEHTGSPNHYSGKVFTNTIMIDGEGHFWTNNRHTYIGMPEYDGNGIMQGNNDNGHAKITYLREHQKEYKDIEEFNFTGDVQEYKVPKNGKYKIELWGAGGGPSVASFSGLNGLGGYTSGEIELTKDTILYFYVGNKGGNGINGFGNSSGTSFNGGGSGIGATDGDDGGGGGGGATDVRLEKGINWDDFDSLKSRIMVAAGGSGAPTLNIATRNSSGGGLTGVGESWYWPNGKYDTSFNATQTTGNAFGIGGSGLAAGTGGSGGGGGYYGGKADTMTNAYGGGGGGSSFISGHTGCNAISKNSIEDKIEHTGSPNHYSNYVFTNTIMIDGQGHEWVTNTQGEYVGMPTINGEGTMDGNDGDGFARITLIEETK